MFPVEISHVIPPSNDSHKFIPQQLCDLHFSLRNSQTHIVPGLTTRKTGFSIGILPNMLGPVRLWLPTVSPIIGFV